ncbi:MAG: COX15/CtaA family protein [Planctomycetaceae bacterium]
MSPYQPTLHRLAIATAVLALLPITVGALVTTMKWGMAFLDYPTSDGHNMLLYPWLKSASDKFTEHGHRLAGMLIGIVSAGLMVVAWMKESRGWVKVAATIIPFCVLLQGLLGGARVLADDERMAMFHGSFAAVVFTLMAAVAMWTGRRWIELSGDAAEAESDRRLKPLAFALPFVVFGQYLLGGALRHLGTMLHEHIGMAVIASLFAILVAVQGMRSGVPMLRRSAGLILAVLLAQVALGIGSYVTKFGFATWGVVAVQHSLPQVVFRTSHTVVGMLLLTAAVLHALRVARVAEFARRTDCRSVRSIVEFVPGRTDYKSVLPKGGAR